MSRCLYCYKELSEGMKDFHPACARKFFGVRMAPELPYVRSQLGDLAREVVRSQTTLTGVQAKLSLGKLNFLLILTEVGVMNLIALP